MAWIGQAAQSIAGYAIYRDAVGAHFWQVVALLFLALVFAGLAFLTAYAWRSPAHPWMTGTIAIMVIGLLCAAFVGALVALGVVGVGEYRGSHPGGGSVPATSSKQPSGNSGGVDWWQMKGGGQ